MSEITVVKRTDEAMSDAERAAVRKFFFEILGGLTDHDERRWRWLLGKLYRMGSGEMFKIGTEFARYGAFHRYHMAMEAAIFNAQERIQSFEQFRSWLKLGAGFVDWMPGPKGGVFPVPKSISYADCDEGDMREFHDKAVEFLRGGHASKYLWPAQSTVAAGEAMESILARFGS